MIEDRVFGEAPGPVTREAVAAYRGEVEGQLGLAAEDLWAGR